MKKLFTTMMVLIVFSTTMFAQYVSSVAVFNSAGSQALPDSIRPWAKDQGLRGVYVANDVTGNGKQEVLATDYSNGGRVHMFEVTGNVLELIWSSPSRYPLANTNSTPRWIRSGDMDGDGNLEVIFPVGLRYAGEIQVWEYDKVAHSFGTEPAITLTYDALASYGAAYRVRTDREAAGCADYDGDGKSELIVANESGNVYILGVTGDIPGFASFTVEGGDPATTLENKFSGGSYWDSIPADIDGDGVKEIVNHYWNFYGLWSIKPTGADQYKYPTPTTDGRTDHYAEFTKNMVEDACAYMGIFPADVNGDNRDEIFGVMYGGSSATNYLPFLVNAQPNSDGVYGWVASINPDSISYGIIGDGAYQLAGQTGGSHWGANAYDLDGDGKDVLLLGGSAGYNLIGMKYNGAGSIYDAANYTSKLLYTGDAAVYHNVDIYDSLGVMDTVRYEGPFVSRIYAGSDLNSNGKKDILLGYQSVADSITYKTYSWDVLSSSFVPDSSWKVFNPTAINLRVLDYEVTGVKPLDLSIVTPDDYTLGQNFPNPFNPSTKINFSLPVNKNISLKVYDILGNEIKTLFNGDMAKGSYQITWDGTNNFNQAVASGTYISVLKFGNFTKSVKMSLVK